MVTAQEVLELALDLVEERLDSGAISPSDTISYKVRTPGILTMLQAELIKQGDIFSTYEIANSPITNLLGFISNFDIQSFEGEELTFECNESAKAYYFEVDNDATVYIEDFNGTWNTLETVTATSTSGFTAYKGVVTPSTGATKSRLRFAGSYYYRTLNRALFGVSFASSDDVPVYSRWVKQTMPSDFKSVNEIINIENDGNYAQNSAYKWEGRSDLYFNYYFKGKIRIVYRPVPSIIALPSPISDPISTQMQVDDVTARTIIPYGLASHLLLQENGQLASFFQQRFEELSAKALKPPPSSIEMIGNSYGSFN